MRRAAIVVWLTVVWVTLWEALTWANVVGGLVVAVAAVYLLPPREARTSVGFRPLAAARLLFYFLWELLVASSQVVWEIITPEDHTRPAVVSVQTRSTVPGHITAVANMISLTPGTLSLEVDHDTRTIYIHVLHLDSFEKTRAMVSELETLTLAAFPPRVGPATAEATS